MSEQRAVSALPPIPNKQYFSIGEVAELCGVETHVLRYWEQEFPQLKPNRRSGNRRYFQLKDVLIIRNIRKLLYERGFTIQGARQQLSGKVVDAGLSNQHLTVKQKLRQIIGDLESLKRELA